MDILIIEIEANIPEIEAIHEIEITVMTKMTTTLEVRINSLTLYGDHQ
ncbi:13563_t:CDS:2 [Gigaspora margarita]|uniref:13563_t:CDS:1 n=1 Tax=Gigaspora margarita TaxID=4874 RepID=A0ABM8W5U2_GIGMA|nr:13563_t:CDS:2 [Gigaspora margarita]